MIAPESAVRACDPRRPALYAAARTVSGSASGLLALSDGELEDECSSIANTEEALRWQAAQILRGLI